MSSRRQFYYSNDCAPHIAASIHCSASSSPAMSHGMQYGAPAYISVCSVRLRLQHRQQRSLLQVELCASRLISPSVLRCVDIYTPSSIDHRLSTTQVSTEVIMKSGVFTVTLGSIECRLQRQRVCEPRGSLSLSHALGQPLISQTLVFQSTP